MRQRAATVPCATDCGATVRQQPKSTPICRACMNLAEAIFRREHSPRDADWQVARNRFFGKADVVISAVRAELAARAA